MGARRFVLGLSCAPSVPDIMRRLLIQVAQAHGVSVQLITGRGRVAHVVEARREFCKLAHRAGYSLPAIARAINRDHTTVLHFVRRNTPA